jgi:hypothetical protein
VLGRARCIATDRNGADVRADERLSFAAMAEADRQLAKRRLSGLIGDTASLEKICWPNHPAVGFIPSHSSFTRQSFTGD